MELKSVKFTSDHGVLTDNNSDWTDSGTIYSEPEWVKDPATNNPISHTKNTKLTVDVTVKVEPSGLTFDLIGDGVFNYVDFIKTGNTSTGVDQVVTITADTALPNQVDTLLRSIFWKIKLTAPDPDIEEEIGGSGPHQIYVTYGTPSGSVVTEKRMNWCCAKADNATSPSAVASGIQTALNTNPPNDNGSADPVSPRWLLLAGGAYEGSCIHQAELMELACKMLGVSASTAYVWPSSDTFCDTEEPRFCEHHPDDYEYLKGYTGFWNNWEGVCAVGATYYAVWPKITADTKVDVLRTWLASPNYQAWRYWDASSFQWKTCEIQSLP